MKDSFYTPTVLANRLVEYVVNTNIEYVADFCVGDGELLRAALNRWPNVKCYGTDISQNAINSVKFSHPQWTLHKCDFLNSKARNRSTVLKEIESKVDLILLNPPFSCIGGARVKVNLDGEQFDASTAMAFLVETIKYLSKNGCIYAILPNSVAYSQKDKKLWNKLVENYSLSIIEESNEKHFSDCSPNIILVSIHSFFPRSVVKKIKRLNIDNKDLKVFRGKIGMHTLKTKPNKGKFLIHSTNLKNNRIEDIKFKTVCKHSEITGPALLIPRVGLPNPQKICTLLKNETFVLSDCILAVKTKTNQDSNNLKKSFIKNWKDVSNLYKGTGAKYITVERLEQFLNLKE